MSLLSRIFDRRSKGSDAPKAKPGAESAPVQAAAARSEPLDRQGLPITLEVLGTLFPIRNLSSEVVGAFSFGHHAEVFERGSLLFSRGEVVDAIHYLLEGTINMDVGDGLSYTVEAGTPKANFPLCSGKTYSATAVAQTPVQILRVSPKIMGISDPSVSTSRSMIDPLDPAIPERVRSSRLFQAFCQHCHNDELTIPTLPDIAVKLRKAVQSHMDIAKVVDIIQLDPAIAGKLVHVANSPLYLPSKPIDSCHDAVLRLGLAATRNLVVSYSVRQIFKCQDPVINRLLHEEWRRSLNLSCLCFVLASENPGIGPDQALLAGLVSDIGVVPFLYFVENFPKEFWTLDDVRQAIPWLRGQVGTFVLKRWDFPEELAQIPLLAEDWFRDGQPELTVADIVVLSKLHAYIGTPRMAELPAINSIPACGKLKNGELSPEYSLKVLHDAKDKITQALKTFES